MTATVTVRRTRADRIDALLAIAERGVEVAERIANCMEQARRRNPRKKRKPAPRSRRRSG